VGVRVVVNMAGCCFDIQIDDLVHLCVKHTVFIGDVVVMVVGLRFIGSGDAMFVGLGADLVVVGTAGVTVGGSQAGDLLMDD
ncbi:hypothetical protein RA265_29215, partial [Pseudomonas syringae pv. tagetis]|uniref:hypothetical protein n=1 Tax=Pseudomonas syringae group genomosp. 7 TaxID=251699 RepID=UPI0037704C1F